MIDVLRMIVIIVVGSALFVLCAAVIIRLFEPRSTGAGKPASVGSAPVRLIVNNDHKDWNEVAAREIDELDQRSGAKV